VDFYGGYKGTFADDFSYDVGLIKYYYPGSLAMLVQRRIRQKFTLASAGSSSP
jgi:uncharacterized protein (TIGR02001 family)